MKTLVLKRSLSSKKFNVIFPSNTKLNSITIGDEIFAEHPTNKNIYIKVSQKNIK